MADKPSIAETPPRGESSAAGRPSTGAKAGILAAIRAHAPAPAPLPNHAGPWLEFDDPLTRFMAALEVIGARAHRVANLAAIDPIVASIPELAEAKKIVSCVPGVGRANVELDAIDDPHALADVDLAILPGEFGVAENGAIWVSSRGLRQRAVFFITQRLALVLPAAEIVSNMHQAYARAPIGQSDWGAFLAGPSKTADIEQALVVGAHGPRSLDVFCVG